MTPGARVAAAIAILDEVLAGEPVEKALTGWARRSRYAGSGDRAKVRDHVFGVLRCRRSAAWAGNAETGRGLMLGTLRLAGQDPDTIFDGIGHAPPTLDVAERQPPPSLAQAPDAVRLDWPDWLMAEARRSLKDELEPVLAALRLRAPIFARVNQRMGGPDDAIAALAEDAISAQRHPAASCALQVTDNARRIKIARAYRDGLVELQDAASQAVVEALLPLNADDRVLDYCAGGGGKALGLAAASDANIFAHDADPGRMRDLPDRARRAGVCIDQLDTVAVAQQAPFDLVLVDAPCSGSGAWRRAPEGKWSLNQTRLDQLMTLQAEILEQALALAAPNGRVAYATCSLFECENRDQIDRALARCPGWRLDGEHRFRPGPDGDGFYLALLTRR